MKKFRTIVVLSILILYFLTGFGFFQAGTVHAQSDSDGYPVSIYFFWGNTCPHCAKAKPVLMAIAAQNPNVTFLSYEIYNNPTNGEYFVQVANAYGFDPTAVPTIFVGEKYWVGFSEVMAEEIKSYINECSVNGCPDLAGGALSQEAIEAGLTQLVIEEIPPTNTPVPVVTTAPIAPTASSPTLSSDEIEFPVIGRVHLAGKSVWVSTALISFVDGFNPCSLWVLSMLLALTLHTGSRKKVLLIGIIFLTVTAIIYGLFIAGLFTVLTVISFVGWIQVLVALVALFFAIINIKDYFWYKEGVSFTISDEKKPGIFSRMRKLVDPNQSFGGLVTGTVVLAAGVSLVEFSCTAGFPVLWTNLLVAQKVSAGLFIALLVFYLVIYQLDELVIFFTAVYTLKASRVEEKQGRILKLIGGILMLTLAGVMLIDPSLMNNLGSSMGIFGMAILFTILILVIHRGILPSFGIRIGTEFSGQRKSPKVKSRHH